MNCPVCSSPLMATPSGSCCPNGHGGVFARMRVGQICENHARLCGLPELRKLRLGWISERTGFGYSHEVWRCRDVVERPVACPEGYHLGFSGHTIILLVPEETYWREVQYAGRRAHAGLKMPARFEKLKASDREIDLMRERVGLTRKDF